MRTILITGGNRGIGRAVVERLARDGHRVIFTARNQDKADRTALDLRQAGVEVEARVLELSSMAEVRRFCLRYLDDDPMLDVLVHSAGMLAPPPQRTVTDDGLELTMAVNVYAPFLMSRLLMPALNRPGRIFALSSSLHRPGSRGPEVNFRFDDVDMQARYDPEVAYKNSKLALIWVMSELSRRYGAEGVQADALCPGFVPTTAAKSAQGAMTRFLLRYILPRFSFATSLDESATAIARLITETPLDEPGGRFFRVGQLEAASEDARDGDQAARFFELAERRLSDFLRTPAAGP